MHAKVLRECLQAARKVQLLNDAAPEQWAPEDWDTALRECLRIELAFHLSTHDLAYVEGLLFLSRQAAWSSPDEWTAAMNAVHEAARALPLTPKKAVVVKDSTPRCSPDDPQLGHIDHDDPATAPPHGTRLRYSSKHFSCRCEHCRTAHTDYRRERRIARGEV